MEKRVQVNSLVIATLDDNGGTLSASQIYSELNSNHANVLREERVHSFRGFVKILNSFPNIETNTSKKFYTYSLKK